jgi:hypothetical protein
MDKKQLQIANKKLEESLSNWKQLFDVIKQSLDETKKERDSLYAKWTSLLKDKDLDDSEEIFLMLKFEKKSHAERFKSIVKPFVASIKILRDETSLQTRVEARLPNFYVDMVSKVGSKVIEQDREIQSILNIN